MRGETVVEGCATEVRILDLGSGRMVKEGIEEVGCVGLGVYRVAPAAAVYETIYSFFCGSQIDG